MAYVQLGKPKMYLFNSNTRVKPMCTEKTNRCINILPRTLTEKMCAPSEADHSCTGRETSRTTSPFYNHKC